MQDKRGLKERITVWINPEILKTTDSLIETSNCRSRSEYVQNAISLYNEYIYLNKSNNFLPSMITSAIDGVIENSENRVSRVIFKLAVEMSMMMNILASISEVDNSTLEKLRIKCVSDVKKSIGSITVENVMEYQKNRC